MRIGLVACGSKKTEVPGTAELLYTSDLFAKSRQYALNNSERWFILSAKHGLVAPDEVLEPYDLALHTLSRAEQREWAERVLAKLLPVLSPGDTVVMLAGITYRRDLLGPLEGHGVTVEIPLEGLRIGEQLRWLTRANEEHEQHPAPASATAGSSSDLQRFHALIDELDSRIGGAPQLRACTGKMPWPERGVYFFFEPDEYRPDGSGKLRVVRVGTHAVSRASRTRLWDRLRTHRGALNGNGNHRGSIFRLHVGNALLNRDGQTLETWGRGSNAPKEVRENEQKHERLVSEFIGRCRVLWLPVPDEPGADSDRAFIERNAIGLLSGAGRSLMPPAEDWLGNHSSARAVRKSGLWNIAHVGAHYDPDFLRRMEEYVELC